MTNLGIRKRARIRIISAGGTIGSVDEGSGVLDAVGEGKSFLSKLLDQVVSRTPEIQGFQITIKHMYSFLSEDMHPSDWSDIAYSIAKELQDSTDLPDGIVVTHGTDTLAYTASAMSWMLEDLPIPVVFTAAFYPPNHPETDARENLRDSILFAANESVAGVYVVFLSARGSRDVILANRAVSIPNYGRHFASADGRPVGEVLPNRRIRVGRPKELPQRQRIRHPVKPDTEMSDEAKLIRVYPGLRPSDLALLAKDCRALLLELYHSGTASTRRPVTRSGFGRRDSLSLETSLEPVIRECVENGKLVFGIPMEKVTGGGNIYQSTHQLVEAGLIPVPPMSLEASYTKLLWLLGKHVSNDQVKRDMRRSLRGELFDPDYLGERRGARRRSPRR